MINIFTDLLKISCPTEICLDNRAIRELCNNRLSHDDPPSRLLVKIMIDSNLKKKKIDWPYPLWCYIIYG